MSRKTKEICIPPKNLESVLTALAELFKNFGDSTRVKILYALLDRSMNVTELANHLQISQPAVSQQLRMLRKSLLVKSERVGQQQIYSLSDSHVRSIINIGLEHVLEA
ncbi:MAG: winged helix-turn-helix transcriptional regulator [Treponema sp.]|nr:winged helix-turn-helix transcriptional regulator [Treponema sp.]